MNPKWVITLSLVIGLGCNPGPSPQGEESKRVEALQGENKRLRQELLTAKKEAMGLQEDLTTLRKVHQESLLSRESVKSTVPSRPVHSEIDPPEERLAFDASCNAHIQLKVEGAIPPVIQNIEGRLKGWELQRIQVLNGREESTLDIFFSGPRGSAEKARESLEGAGLLSVHGLAKRELQPFKVGEVLNDFRSLFPEEGRRLKVIGELEATPFATSVKRSDISVFAKQVIHRAPEFTIFPAPGDQPGIWRSRTVAAAPLLTSRDLVQSSTTTDEQGTALFLKFSERDSTRLPTHDNKEKTALAFVLDQTIIRVLSLPEGGTPSFGRVEFNLPHLPPEQAQREVKRVASLLTYPGELPVRVNVAEEECIGDPAHGK